MRGRMQVFFVELLGVGGMWVVCLTQTAVFRSRGVKELVIRERERDEIMSVATTRQCEREMKARDVEKDAHRCCRDRCEKKACRDGFLYRASTCRADCFLPFSTKTQYTVHVLPVCGGERK
jgi:hypothetical protein